MADAVAGATKYYAVFACDALKVAVVVGVAEVVLKHVVVNKADAELRFDFGDAHSFEF